MAARSRGRWRACTALVCVALLALAACGGGGDDGGGDEDADGTGGTTATTAVPDDGRLYIVVASAEGITSPGLDALVQSLYQLPETVLAVVAPDVSLPFPPAPPTDGTAPASAFASTLSGYPGIVVQGDTTTAVQAALDGTLPGLPPDAGTPELVITGINPGQLIGSLADFSANVPPAEAAAATGVPALVVAQGVDTDPPEYPTGGFQARTWVTDRHDALVAGDVPAAVSILSVPSCVAGEPRGVREVPIAADDAGRSLNAVDCASTATDPVDDVDAFNTGYAALTTLATTDPATGATSTTAAGPPTTGVTTTGVTTTIPPG